MDRKNLIYFDNSAFMWFSKLNYHFWNPMFSSDCADTDETEKNEETSFFGSIESSDYNKLAKFEEKTFADSVDVAD